MLFTDRGDAGRQLAQHLRYLQDESVTVLGLARGGVPVAFAVAASLGAPLDVIVVRKLGVPFEPECAFGAIGEDGARVIDATIWRTGLTEVEIAAVEARARAELSRQVRLLRGGRPPLGLRGRTAVIVDDGIATGATARAACQVARTRGAGRVVVAAPVGALDAVTSLRRGGVDVVCALPPVAAPSFAVSEWYTDFTQTTDDQVRALLRKATARPPGTARVTGGLRPA